MNDLPHSKFNDRVWIERRVLGVVNRALAPHQLNGLSDAAIDLWRRRFGAMSQRQQAIAALVTNIARRSKLHVDTSRDVFDDEGVPELSSIERLVAELQSIAAPV
jgi:hypothetical protein